MNKKSKIITILITIMIGVVLLLSSIDSKTYDSASTYYRIYLNGNNIGVIDNKEQLYDLIDSSQSAIKSEYNVKNVYPPNNLKTVAVNTYRSDLNDVNDVYNKIEEQDDFTIKGYIVTIKGKDSKYTINVLNKDIFYNAAKRFVKAFLAEDEYEKYINNTQTEIVETGRIIEGMRFSENITLKEAYISVNDLIYTDEIELTRFLLFGDNPETKSYTVKLGDTIESVSEANKLNVEEFLIANNNYKSKDSILRIGDKVNVTLIDPQLTFIYDLYEIKDEVVYFEKKLEYDKNKPTTYKEITQAGEKGLDRYEEIYSVTNGERSQEAKVTKLATIIEPKNQITTIGTKRNDSIHHTINPVVLEGYWAWPTNKGYVITSYRGWRWGKMHQGIDISGAGNFGSPIYAAADGVVTHVLNSCPSHGSGYGDRCGGAYGNAISINHQNGYTTKYAHLHQTVKVRNGQKVKKGDLIGYMGNSGSSTGAHLHYEVMKSGSNVDPMGLYQ